MSKKFLTNELPITAIRYNQAYELKRVAVLYSELSGYMVACLKALKEHYGVELLVFRWPVVQDAPFDEDGLFGWIDQPYEKNGLKADEILKIVEAFDPQGVLIPGWMDADYLKVARVLKRRGIPVVAGCDTPWTGSMRQRLSKYLAPWYLHTAIDVLWVAGERQRNFARYLGYTSARCWSGLYACDWSKFAAQYEASGGSQRSLPSSARINPHFLYVGRYSEEKGLDLLLTAYQQYREQTEAPWSLVCAGTGIQERLLEGIEGVENRGFVQPEDLPALMGAAEAFVLPSRKEPWGVVVQEAAASGLPLICSTACGAAVHLLQDHYNGFLFEEGDVSYLANCMLQLGRLPADEREKMARRSHELSKQFRPERWAETLMYGLLRLFEAKQEMAPA